jgi:lipoprotein signal peptidase
LLFSFFFFALQVIRLSIGESVCNEVAAWGIGVPKAVLIGIGIGTLPLFLWIMHAQMRGRMMVLEILFLAGGLSNVYERVSFGCVMDYISAFSWFPVFNMADILLTVAVIGFLWENKKVDFYGGRTAPKAE